MYYQHFSVSITNISNKFYNFCPLNFSSTSVHTKHLPHFLYDQLGLLILTSKPLKPSISLEANSHSLNIPVQTIRPSLKLKLRELRVLGVIRLPSSPVIAAPSVAQLTVPFLDPLWPYHHKNTVYFPLTLPRPRFDLTQFLFSTFNQRYRLIQGSKGYQRKWVPQTHFQGEAFAKPCQINGEDAPQIPQQLIISLYSPFQGRQITFPFLVRIRNCFPLQPRRGTTLSLTLCRSRSEHSSKLMVFIVCFNNGVRDVSVFSTKYNIILRIISSKNQKTNGYGS